MDKRDLIYMDYQATTPVDERVVERMLPFASRNFGNPHSVNHSMGRGAAVACENALESISSVLHCVTDEIIFTSGATEANNLAIMGACRRLKRKVVMVGSTEHKSVIQTAEAAALQNGLRLEILPVDSLGFICEDEYKARLNNDVGIVSISAVNGETGTIQGISRLSSLAHEVGAMFHCDAAQALPAVSLEQLISDVDLASFSGHKIYGPKGVGLLYIRRDLHPCIEPIMYGGDQQHGLRAGTLPVPLCVGLQCALELMHDGGHDERIQISKLRDRFLQGLKMLPYETLLNGPSGSERHPGNVNVQFVGCNGADLLDLLQFRIAASTGSACSTGINAPSQVLLAMGNSARAAYSSVRFGFGRFTTLCDVETAVSLIKAILPQTMAMSGDMSLSSMRDLGPAPLKSAL